MSKDILKKAAADALDRELSSLPSEGILSERYLFTANFTERMEKLFFQFRKSYVNIFGYDVKRAWIVYPLLFVFTAIVIFSNLEYKSFRYIFSIGVMLILGLLSPRKNGNTEKNEKDSEDFGGRYIQKHATGMIDISGVDPYPHRVYPGKELEYTIPAAPDGFTVKNDSRSASTHIIQFADAYGRTVAYEKRLLKTAVLLTVDFRTSDAAEFTLNSCPAVRFTKDGENYLIWEDRYHQFALHSACEYNMLLDMAQKIEVEII